MSSVRLSLLLVCLAAVAVRGTDPSCAFTRSTFDNILQMDENGVPSGLVGNVFDRLQGVAGNICELSETCCSKEAEDSFRKYIADHYRNEVLTKLTEPLMVCHNHSFFDNFKQFIEARRSNLVDIMQGIYGSYFDGYLDIFDGFFEYLQSTVDTGNTCRIAEKWNEVFYEVFLGAYFGHPSTRSASELPTSEAFRQCFYQHVFLATHGETLSINLNGFLRAYNYSMRYLRALKTLDKVIVGTADYLFQPGCKASIMKMTHCSSCAGYMAPTCGDLCLNVLRGCLVDLSDLLGPFEEFSAALIDMQKAINTRNGLHYLWGQWSNLDRLFLEMISETYSNALSMERMLLTTCDVDGLKSPVKRQVPDTPRVPRDTVPIPADSLNHSAYCLAEALPSVRMLPEAVCVSASTSNNMCWNGKTVGSYGRAVLSFDRESQINNPEMVFKKKIRYFEQQIANLKVATREMKILTDTYQCGEDDEDENCRVPLTCEYYNIVDAPTPPAPEASGSGLICDDTTTPSNVGSGCDNSDTTTPSYVVPTTQTPSESTTPTAETLPQTNPSVPGGTTTDTIITGTATGPGDEETKPTAIVDSVGKGSASVLGPSLTLITLVLFCLFLFY